jgi:chromosome segregation ATPase
VLIEGGGGHLGPWWFLSHMTGRYREWYLEGLAHAILVLGALMAASPTDSAMEDNTMQELKALVAENSRAIGRQEKLQAERWEQWQEELSASRKQWQEELTASRREYDRMVASLERSMEYANRQLGKLGLRPESFVPRVFPN